jgi:hypothetical protein
MHRRVVDALIWAIVLLYISAVPALAVNCTTTIQAGDSDVPMCGNGASNQGRPPYSNAQLSTGSACNR